MIGHDLCQRDGAAGAKRLTLIDEDAKHAALCLIEEPNSMMWDATSFFMPAWKKDSDHREKHEGGGAEQAE